MPLTLEQKQQIAAEFTKKRAVMGDTGFETYLNKIESAIPQAKEMRQTEQNKFDTDVAPKGVLGALARFTGVEKMGVGLGASLASLTGSTKGLEESLNSKIQLQGDLIKRIRDKKSRGEDTSRLQRALDDLGAGMTASADAIGEIGTGGVSNREVVGSAIRTAGTIASFGTYGGAGATTGALSKITTPQLTTANTVGRGIFEGAKTGALQGAKMGGIFGAVSGTATGIEQNKGVLGTAFEAAKQGVVGVGTGALAGGVVGGAAGGYQARSNRIKEIDELLLTSKSADVSPVPPASPSIQKGTAQATPPIATTPTKPIPQTDVSRRRAGYTVEAGKVVEDPKAQRILKQGVDDRTVAIMQSMSPEDKAAAKKMIQVAKEASDSGIPTQRQQEVVGETFMKRVKDVELLNKQAGGQIDDIARKQLAGKPVDYTRVYDDFVSQLEREGVDVDLLAAAKNSDEVANAFRGSSFEDLSTVQRTVKTVLNRVKDGNVDGYNLHRTKRFIDNQVTYGKNAEGLVGDAERLLKGLRAGIDEVLDVDFPDYNAANTQYKDTIGALDEMRRLIGKDYLGSKNIAELRAGEVMTRLLGNARAKPMSALQALEETAAKYGKKYGDSVLKQIRFADLLDTVYDTVPEGSLEGRVKRGTEAAAASFINRMRQNGLLSASIDEGIDIAQSMRGVSPEKAREAIEAFFN